MLQAIEAEISREGQVTLLEPNILSGTARASVTILALIGRLGPAKGNGRALLQILDSPALAGAPYGDPARMEDDIAANRNAGDTRSPNLAVARPQP